MQKLSFLESRFTSLVNLLPSLVKGLQKATALYEEDGKWFRLSISGNELQDKEYIQDEELIERLLPFCTTRKQFIWLAEEDLPFETRSGNVLQLQLTQETERGILVFFLEKPDTHQKDLLFLYFNPDQSYFGLRKKSGLSTQEKSIVAHVLWNSIQTVSELKQSDYQLYSEIIEYKRQTESEARATRAQLEKERSARGDSLVEYTNILLEKWQKELKTEIKITQRGYDKIKREAKSFKSLEYSLEKSIRIAYNLRISESEAVLLDDLEITLAERQISVDNQSTKPVLGRLESTRNLLDKYEISAQKVKEAGERVLGKTVGQYCTPPISNAAITDAVKNHRDRIKQLLSTYPDNWPIIRTEFKTITNLLLPEKSLDRTG